MRIKYISNSLGLILTDIGIVTTFPVIVAAYFREWNNCLAFLTTGMFAIVLGSIFKQIDKHYKDANYLNDIKRSEALTVASLTWIIFGIVASIPFLFEGFSITDALFEAVSGITTTGATILTNFDLSRSLLFWRSFTQWLGGMGIIVLFVAILPQFAVAGRQMFFAEAPGPTEEKFTPRIKNTASALWIVYAALTGLCALCLWCAGMPIFDSVCNAFSTLAAGGFSPNPRSIGGYNSEIIIYITMFFMFVAGTSFVIQSKALAKFDIKLFWKSEEFRFYLKVILFVSFILAILLLLENHYTPLHAMTASLYQVLSLSTSTGSSSEDYHLWSLNAKLILFLSMFISSCAGSAGGGVKITRWLLLFKYMKNEMYKILHPNAVLSIKLDRRVVSNDVLKQTLFFMFCFFIIFGLSALLITLKENNLVIGVTSSIASLGGVGPAFGHIIGPMGNYSTLAEFTKIILIINMLVGRLEIIPFLVLFHKDFWTKG